MFKSSTSTSTCSKSLKRLCTCTVRYVSLHSSRFDQKLIISQYFKRIGCVFVLDSIRMLHLMMYLYWYGMPNSPKPETTIGDEGSLVDNIPNNIGTLAHFVPFFTVSSLPKALEIINLADTSSL